MKKLKFLVNYNPRKKGEIAEAEGRIADFYLNAGLAKLACDCVGKLGDKEGCADCEKQSKVNAVDKEAVKVLEAQPVAKSNIKKKK